MRRTPRILLATLLCSLGTTDALAQSGPLDARNIKPAVMLLVDTSGSMERLPATPDSSESPLPTCTGNTAADTLQKNRWALTLEALTGSFQNFTCRRLDRSGPPFMSTDYDYGYYLPHFDFGTNPPQNTDGILDSFANRVKFGLMTFDGVGTTINGETLVPYSLFDDPVFSEQVLTAPGMYSYGPAKRLSFPGCDEPYGVNAGSRGEGAHPGALISVGATENSEDILAINARIQSSLLGVRPFGGTPIPAMLDDLRFYLTDHDDVAEGSDRFFACRKRTAVLITDGAPDALFRDSRFQCEQEADSGVHATCAAVSTGDAGAGDAGTTYKCECPYDPAQKIARDLVNVTSPLLDRLIVIAYNVQDETALETLEEIAQEGWPRADDANHLGTSPYPFLVRANGPDELRQRINNALRGGSTGVTSRSVPISVNTGSVETGPDSKRFDINAGFAVGEDEDTPWQGYLYRRRVLCEGTTVNDQTELDDELGDEFHTSLNRQSVRDLFTVTPQAVGDVNGTLRNTAYYPVPVYDTDATDFRPDRLPSSGFSPRNERTPTGGTFPVAERVGPDDSMSSSQALTSDNINPRVSFDTSLNPLLFGSSTTDTVRQRIVDYVRGVSRPTRVLADIYHSNPVALLPLNAASTSRFADINARYSDWLRKIIATGPGAHYGADGRPGVVFVGTNDGVLHAFNLDDWNDAAGQTVRGSRELWGFLPPALFGKMGAMSAPAHQFMFDGTPEVKDVVLQDRPDAPPIFRTILVSALRGAPAFVALDVTFPESPVFMWQSTFADVGETIGNPALTQVEVEWLGERQQRAIAILPGGRGLAATSAECPATGGTGHALTTNTRAAYPLGNSRNVRCWQRRGRGLYVVDVATGQLLQEFGPEHFPSPVSGSVVVDAAGVGTASAAYVFDADGILWRLSMVGTDPSRWRVAPIFDMFDSPNLPTGVRSWEAGRAPQYAPTLTRDRAGNLVILAGTGDTDNPLDTVNHRAVSLTELRAPDDDDQIAGTMKLNWSYDFDRYESVTGPLTVFENAVYWGTFLSGATTNQCGLGTSYKYGVHAYEPIDPAATQPAPAPKLVRENASPSDPLDVRQQVPGSSLLIGLTVTRQPTCRDTSGPINAITMQATGGPAGGGLYQLRAMMAGNSDGGRSGGAMVTEALPQTIPVTYPSSVSSWAGAVE